MEKTNLRYSGTGFYAYETAEDGLVEYKTRKPAIKNAAKAAKREHSIVDVRSPSGKIICRIIDNTELIIDSLVYEGYTPYEAAKILGVNKD